MHLNDIVKILGGEYVKADQGEKEMNHTFHVEQNMVGTGMFSPK